MLSRTVYKQQRGRRLLTAMAGVSLVAGLFLASGTVLAVHDLDFQLDGDVSTACPVAGDGPAALYVGPEGLGRHVQRVYERHDPDDLAEHAIPDTNGTFTAATFTRDFRSGPDCTLNSSVKTFCTSDTTTYATGSKDTLDINTGWACNFDHNVNSKIDIMNAYSAAFTRSYQTDTSSCTSAWIRTRTTAPTMPGSGSSRATRTATRPAADIRPGRGNTPSVTS